MNEQNKKFSAIEKSISEIKAQNDFIKTSNNDIEKSLDFVSTQIENINVKIGKLEEDRKGFTNEIIALNDKIDNLTWANTKTCIEIRNVPNTKQRETMCCLFQMINQLQSYIDPKHQDLHLRDVYLTLFKKNAPSSTIIVEFMSTLDKERFL